MPALIPRPTPELPTPELPTTPDPERPLSAEHRRQYGWIDLMPKQCVPGYPVPLYCEDWSGPFNMMGCTPCMFSFVFLLIVRSLHPLCFDDSLIDLQI